jgi:HAE1 family hydrophobic/amphiphilic exporter-1
VSRLSQLAVAKRSVTLLLASGLFLGGIFAWGNLQQELLPDIDFPVVTVIAPYPGAGASDVAEQIAEPIERAISGVPRLESLRSTSANSIALVVAEFSFGTNVKETEAAIQENVTAAGLPAGVEPIVSTLNINASPVIIASIAAPGDGGFEAAAEIARREILPSIVGLEGVAKRRPHGGRAAGERHPRRDRLTEPASPCSRSCVPDNNLTFPSGQLPVGDERVPVSTTSSFATIEEIEQLVVGMRVTPTAPGAEPSAPEPITLADVGTVELGSDATTGYARTNGQPSLTLVVTKTSTANTVQVTAAVQDELSRIGAAHPSELSIVTVSDLSTFIKESQDGLLREGGLGAVFAVVTIFLFLFSLRSTLVAAISIPLSVLTALVIMQVTGVSLNIMTLGGLAVAVGRVVDDAIVVLENIYRHRALGEDKLTAVTRGPREVASAITASTLTTVAVFLPLGFVGGLVTEFFLPFSLTVTFALLASLICALTVVPVLAYLFIDRVNLTVDESGEPTHSPWVRTYVPLISLALRNRWSKLGVIVIAAVLFVASLSLVSSLPTQFINAGSEKILQAVVIPPEGATSESVLAQATKAETIIRELADVELIQTSVPGEGDTGFTAVLAALSGQPANSATLTIRLDPATDLAEAIERTSSALAPIKTDGYDANVSEAAGLLEQFSITGGRPGRDRGGHDRCSPRWPIGRPTTSPATPSGRPGVRIISSQRGDRRGPDRCTRRRGPHGLTETARPRSRLDQPRAEVVVRSTLMRSRTSTTSCCSPSGRCERSPSARSRRSKRSTSRAASPGSTRPRLRRSPPRSRVATRVPCRPKSAPRSRRSRRRALSRPGSTSGWPA